MIAAYIAITVIFAVAMVAFVWWFIWFSNSKLTLTRYFVKADNAPQGGVRIVHLSDLHAKRFGKNNNRLICAVAAQAPDFICITGDIIHKYRKRDISVAVEAVKALSQVAPVLFVSGNHEMRNKKYSCLRRNLIDAGAIVLDDTSGQFCGVTVVGLNCANLKNNKIFDVTPDTQNFKILLAHEPQFIISYARAGYDLVLSGHAHGGQWRVPFTKKGIYSPGQGLFPKLVSGEHMCGSTRMIISRGLGNSEFPLRLFNQPEIVVITISK
jgi:hypothetical protein